MNALVCRCTGQIHVAATGGNDALSCGPASAPCSSLEYAMDTVAAHNDTILVAAGAYSIPDGGLTVPAKNLTLQAAGEVLYTCSGFGPGFRVNTTVRLSGFTIRGCGIGSPASSDSRGILIYRTSAVVIESVIVENCHSEAGGQGGGIAIAWAKAVFHNVTVRNNTAASAGGVSVYGDGTEATFTQCAITGNRATYSPGVLQVKGGGIRISGGAKAVFYNVTVSNNSAASAGGVIVTGDGTEATFTQCAITGNRATEDTGGLQIEFGARVNCTETSIADNLASPHPQSGSRSTAGGVALLSTANSTFNQCNITRNVAQDDGGGVYFWIREAHAHAVSSTFINCHIDNNAAVLGNGGGLFSDAGPQPIFIGCSFNENAVRDPLNANRGGGAGWIVTVVCCLQACGCKMPT